jgi:hypothetical protein
MVQHMDCVAPGHNKQQQAKGKGRQSNKGKGKGNGKGKSSASEVKCKTQGKGKGNSTRLKTSGQSIWRQKQKAKGTREFKKRTSGGSRMLREEHVNE